MCCWKSNLVKVINYQRVTIQQRWELKLLLAYDDLLVAYSVNTEDHNHDFYLKEMNEMQYPQRELFQSKYFNNISTLI